MSFLFFLLSILCAFPAISKTKQLFVSEGKASSFLQSNWNKYQENYHPNYAFDNNPKTAWVEGVDGEGSGEFLHWQTSKLENASKVVLKIRNGYQKSKALFEANAIPKKVKITLHDKGGKEFHEQEFDLKKEMRWQELELIPKNPARGFSGVTLKILETYPGKTYKDTCISDIETFVESKVPYDEIAEKQKFKDLVAWTKTRLQTARYFSQLPMDYPAAGTKFGKTISQKIEFSVGLEDFTCNMVPKPSIAEILKPGTKLISLESEVYKSSILTRLKNFMKEHQSIVDEKNFYKLTFTKAALAWAAPDSDGQKELDNAIKFVRASEISFFEASKPVSSIHKNSFSATATSNAHLRFFDTGKTKIKSLFYWEKKSIQERGIYEYVHFHVFEYDESGKLLRFAEWTPKKMEAPKDTSFPNFKVHPESWNSEKEIGNHIKFVELNYNKDKFNRFESLGLFEDEYDCEYAYGGYDVWDVASQKVATP